MTDNRLDFLPAIAVRRPVTVMMVFAILSIWGFVSFNQLPVELLPNSSFNNISIMISIRGGMSPQSVEQSLTIPIEETMSTLSGLKSIQSTSKEGRATIVLSFSPDTDMDIKTLEVSERFDAVKNNLPKEAERPVIAKYEQNDMPIVSVSVFSDDRSVEDLRLLTDTLIKPSLQRISGVANVEISGGREKKIVIDVNEQALLPRRLSMDDITRAVSRNNLNVLAGELELGPLKIALRTRAQYEDIQEIENIVVSSKGFDDVIRVRDVASVSYQYMDQTTLSRMDGRPVVSVYVQKESNANTVSVSDSVTAEISRLQMQMDEDVHLNIVNNQAEFIKSAIHNVLSSLGFGAVLAVFVLYLFLGSVWPTIVISLSIPLSVVITLGLMQWFGISVNVMTLSGLALGIGMLVDNSIVVLENIARKIDQGREKIMACIEGTGEIFLALIASTSTTLVVFLPIVFVNPQTRIMYGGFSLTVVFSLVSSLVVSMILVPCLSARNPGKTQSQKGKIFVKVQWLYASLLTFAIKYRYAFIVSMMCMLFLCVLAMSKMDKDLSGGADEGKFTIFIELKSGAKIDLSNQVVARIEEVLKSKPEVENYAARIEGWSSKIYVQLKKDRLKNTSLFLETLRPLIIDLGEKENAFIYTSSGKSVGGTEVLIDIYGYQYETLLELSSKFSEKIKSIGGFYDFKLRYKPGRPEMAFVVDKERAGLMGFSVKDIADSLHAKIRGLQATRIYQDGKELETIIRLEENHRKSLAEIKKLKLVNRFGEQVPLAEVVKFRETSAPSEIWHVGKTRMIQISASTHVFTLDQAVLLIEEALQEVPIPAKYSYEFGGNYKETRETYQNLMMALGVMVFLVFILLASLFESYIQPVLIMLTVPLGFMGVTVALIYMDARITMGVLIGCIMLGGIVVNNAIVLIDHMNHLKTQGFSEVRAIVAAGKDRLRPILMTTMTTILGLIPMAMGSGMASSLWSPLAITVIGGLISSTALTLLIIPAVSVMVRDMQEVFSGRRSVYGI